MRPAPSIPHKPGSSLLGLAWDGDQLEVVALRRTNGSIEVLKSLTVTLSLDPLTNEAALVGREIRKHLDAAGIRERRCVVGLPLSWVMTVYVALPDLSEEDLRSVMDLEAERGFPYAPESLVIARSVYRAPDGTRHATLAAVPRDHVARLEAVLAAAQLRPLNFSLGIATLPAGGASEEGVLLLTPGMRGVGLMASWAGGLAALRSLEGAYEHEGSSHDLKPDNLARELRITLGQLPGDLGSKLGRLCVVGSGEAAQELEEAVRGRAQSLGLKVEAIRDYRPKDFPVTLPSGTKVSPALSLAARHLVGRQPELDFLPPKVTAWQRLTERYASRKLVWTGFAAALVVVGLLGAFLAQWGQQVYWTSKWRAMEARVVAVKNLQQQIRQYRPWFDETVPTLGVLRRLSEAFPEDGTVSARSVEIREPSLVTCTGTARDRQALFKALEKLRAAREVGTVKVEQMRGRTPMEFSFNFQWKGQGGS